VLAVQGNFERDLIIRLLLGSEPHWIMYFLRLLFYNLYTEDI
jgi:hypothetical protein